MRFWTPSLVIATLLVGCSLNRTPILPDVGLDGGDAGMDAGRDAPMIDGGPDDANADTPDGGGIDADLDASIDDTGIDAPTDTGVDAPTDTGVDAPTDTGIDAPCVTRCSDPMTLTTCAGAVETVETCELGCYATPAPHCASMVPANVGNTWETFTPLGAVTVTALERINTTMCIWDRATDLTGSIRSADSGGNVCLFVVSSLDVQAMGIVHASGNLALIIISTGDITIAGAIGVDSARSSTLFVGGIAGAGPRGPAAGNGGSSGIDDGGGGGGGFGGAGGPGGTGGASGTAGPARVSGLLPLIGGSAGGLGAGPSSAAGGAGGGTMQLTALGRMTVRGYVGASGSGGSAGIVEFARSGAGGGGGSGGGILLEAVTFSLEAGVINIAGGGGGASSCPSDGGSAGADGIDAPTARAAGGPRSCGTYSADGGAGSGGGQQTGDAGSNNDNGGGGGGGAGRVVFRTPNSTLDLSAAATTLNPTFATSAALYVVSDISRR